jgi:hypothetical protein
MAFWKIVVFWYIFPRFGIMCHEKSGNPAAYLIQIRAPLFIAIISSNGK